MQRTNSLSTVLLLCVSVAGAMALVIFAIAAFASESFGDNLLRSVPIDKLMASISDLDTEQSLLIPPELEEPETVLLSFVGDCMLATMLGQYGPTTFNSAADEKDQEYFFSGVADIFQNDDLTIANCENVFTDLELSPRANGYSPAYWYRSKSANAGIFTVGSVEVVSLANNHTEDYGTQGRIDTIAAVEAAGLEWGNDDKPLVFEFYGVKIGLYCTTMYSTGSVTRIKNWLAETAETTDFQIVYYHGGTERVYTPDAWRVNASRQLADVGADLIIGAHPHVIQPLEFYESPNGNSAVIVYSLGNFLFGGSRTTDQYTVIYQQELKIKDGEIVSAKPIIIPCLEYTVPGDWHPIILDEDTAAYTKIMDFMYGRNKSLK